MKTTSLIASAFAIASISNAVSIEDCEAVVQVNVYDSCCNENCDCDSNENQDNNNNDED